MRIELSKRIELDEVDIEVYQEAKRWCLFDASLTVKQLTEVLQYKDLGAGDVEASIFKLVKLGLIVKASN